MRPNGLIRNQCGLKQVILVGDRGMLTSARIRAHLKPQEGLQWISALKSVRIQQLVAGGALQLSLFDQHDLAEIRHPSYQGERLIACRNPLLAEERKRKRRELLEATVQPPSGFMQVSFGSNIVPVEYRSGLV
jgi:hypothetical protein